MYWKKSYLNNSQNRHLQRQVVVINFTIGIRCAMKGWTWGSWWSRCRWPPCTSGRTPGGAACPTSGWTNCSFRSAIYTCTCNRVHYLYQYKHKLLGLLHAPQGQIQMCHRANGTNIESLPFTRSHAQVTWSETQTTESAACAIRSASYVTGSVNQTTKSASCATRSA